MASQGGNSGSPTRRIERKNSTSQTDRSSVSRRSLLKATAVLGTTGFAGCVGGISGIGGGGGGSGTITIGSPLPTSGSFSAYGNNHRKAIELAVQHANEEGDAGDREVEVKFSDTEGDPNTGRQAAQELLNNGADILSGNYSSAVALSIGELAQRRGVMYQCVGGSNAITGDQCHEVQFNTGNSAVQQSVTMPYLLNNTQGRTVFILYSDYAWAQSYTNWNVNNAIPDNGGKVIGTQAVPLGTNDWSQPVTQARNAGADHIHFAVTGSDLVRGVNQAFEFGLQENSLVSAASATLSDVKALGINVMTNPQFYPGGTAWYWQHDTPATKKFSDAFRSQYNTVPLNFSGCHYAGTRTFLQAVGEAGSTDPADMRPVLEGKQIFPQLWGVGEKYRACDHRASIATMVVQAKKNLNQQDVNSQSVYRILSYPENPTSVMRSCSKTGCQLG